MEEERVTPGDLQIEIFGCMARLTFMARCAKGIEEYEDSGDIDLTGFAVLCNDVNKKLEGICDILGDWPKPTEEEDSKMEAYLQTFDVKHREPVRKFIEMLNRKETCGYWESIKTLIEASAKGGDANDHNTDQKKATAPPA